MGIALRYFLFLMLFAFSSCNGTDEGEIRESFLDKYSVKVKDVLLDEAKANAEKAFSTSEDKDIYMHYFFKGYLHGVQKVESEMIIGEGIGPGQEGLNAGLLLYKQHSESKAATLVLEDFGYEYMEVEGTYRMGFEVSDFRPNLCLSNWWLTFQQGILQDWVQQHPALTLNEKNKCHIRGYLAPKNPSGAGHFGMYDREFVVAEIVELK